MTATAARTIVSEITKREVVIPDCLGALSDVSVDYKSVGVFRILTAKDGDERVVWRRESIPEINAAKEVFDRLVAEGFTPYRVGASGEKTSQVMVEFDPTAEEIIFAPLRLLVGG